MTNRPRVVGRHRTDTEETQVGGKDQSKGDFLDEVELSTEGFLTPRVVPL